VRRWNFGWIGGLALSVAWVGTSLADEASSEAVEAAQVDSTAAADDAEPERDVREVERLPEDSIEEIRITGRRRDETIQQAPVSVTAFDGLDLEDLEVTDVKELARFVPNLQLDEAAATQNAARVFLRGIGNDDPIITDEGGVGITVDDVFLPRAAGTLLSISDVERIEVLAGPQATLYGKNTVGGLVRYLTKKPEWDFNGRASLRVGNFDQVTSRFMLNVPLISDRLAMRLNVGANYNEGLFDNKGPGRDRTLQSRGQQAQVQLRLQASETTEVLLKGYYTNSPNSGFVAKCKLTAGLALNRVDGRLFGTNATGPGTRGDFAEECARDRALDSDEFRSDASTEDELQTTGTSLHVSYESSPSFAFRSITAWNRNETSSRFDFDATRLPISQSLDTDKNESIQDSISQEFNFSGLAMDGRLNWVGGFFGLVEKNQDSERQTSDLPTFLDPEEFRFADLANARVVGSDAAIGAIGTTDIGLRALEPGLLEATGAIEVAPGIFLPGAPLAFEELPLRLTNGAGDCIAGTDQTVRFLADFSDLVMDSPVDLSAVPVTAPSCRREFSSIQTEGFLKSNVTSYAAYGQVGFDIAPGLTFEAGARYTHERKRVARFERVLDSSIPLVREPATIARGFATSTFEFSERFGRFSPSASLRYQPTEDLNLYALWGRGFKSGGFNGRGVGDASELISYGPEKVTSYEVGFKSRWFQRRLTLNGSLFSTNYDDIQLVNIQINQTSGRIIVVTDNAGKARINGAELNLVALPPIDGLTIRANGGITVGRYTKVKPSRDGLLQLVNPNGRLTGTPTYTGSVSVTYRVPLGSLGDLTSTFSWSHQGKKANNPQNTEFSNKVGLLSGRVALELADGKTRIAAFGSNILDREYVANSLDIARQTLQFFGPPRQFGIELIREF